MVTGLYHQCRQYLHHWAEILTEALLRSEGNDFGQEPKRYLKTKVASPEEDVKKLIISATSLEDIWSFLLKRIQSGSEPSFMMFSVVDETAELLRMRFLSASKPSQPFQGEFIPLCDTENHLIKTVLRADTTFANRIQEMGREVYPYLQHTEPSKHHIFSIPLIAKNQAIAIITLGFNELDSFSQAKLSYVYMLRDQLAQVVWNLILLERIQNQPQLDNLTGLITHSSFQEIFRKEHRKAKLEGYPLSLLILDINDLKKYNDLYSHQMGDRAIARLAFIIKQHIRGIDMVARYGNDEIAVLLPERDAPEASEIVHRIIQALNEPHKSIKPFTISVGIAAYPQDSRDLDTLSQLAENAIHFGKYESERSLGSSVTLASDLAHASDQQRIDVFAAQIAKKYGQTGSDLFETILHRLETDAQLESDNLMLETVASLAGAMDAKDKYTRGHSQSVANYAVALAHALELPPSEVEKIRLAAFFHDIGKIGVPESILNKPGPLTSAEYEIMKQHPVIGAQQILKPVTALRDIVPLVEYHHERWDGQGHPVGLKGENIPIGARIVSIVDAFHALTSNRPYRSALPLEEAMRILKDGQGTIWDPEIMDQFLSILEKARCKHQPETALPQSA